MGLLCFSVLFCREACYSSWRCFFCCSGLFRKWIWGGVCNILRWRTQSWKKISYVLCIKFVTISRIVSAMFGTVEYSWYFIGVIEAAMISSGCDEIPTEAETRSQVRRRRAVVTRRLVPLTGIARVPFASSSQQRYRELLEEAFINCMYHIGCGYFVLIHDCSSFLVLVVSDHFSNDPVVTSINATGHQLVTLCRSICAEERAQILEALMSSKYCCRAIHVSSLACVHRLFGYSQS